MICWYCKRLIADETSVCPCCGVAVVNPARAVIEYPAYEEFRQNGFFNPYEEYYRNFQLPRMMPQMNMSFYGRFNAGFSGLQIPQYPAAAMAMPFPMQNQFAPYPVYGLIYPQPRYTEEPRVWFKPEEEEKPEIETIVIDEPVLMLEQSEVDESFAAEKGETVEEHIEEEVKPAEQAKAPVVEEKQTNVTAQSKKTNVLAILGFVFAFILPLIGLILSSVGLSRVKTRNLKGKGLAVAGIILSLIMTFAYAALLVIFSEPLLALLGL